jgi:uncharacterized membrane protein
MRNGLTVLIALGYPVLVYWSIDRIQPRYLALALMLVFLLRWQHLKAGTVKTGSPAFLIAGIVFLAAVSLANNTVLLLGYPIFVSSAFLAVFAYSLLNPPTVVEQLARLQDPDLPPRGVDYTRKVTLVWCGFFLANGLLSAGTVWYGDKAVWGLYNGLISYILMGILMGAEMLVRKQVRKSF